MCMVHVFVFFMYGVSDVVKEGSRSHLLVGIYMMHHFLPLHVYLSIYVFVHAWILCRLQVLGIDFPELPG